MKDGIGLNPTFDDPDTQSLWNAALAARGKPGAIDPIDADNVARSYRGGQSLEEHFPLHTPLGTHPRGVNVRVSEAGHWASLTPNQRGGWHVRVMHPDDPMQEHRADIEARDSHLGPALLKHLARPDVRREAGLL